MPTLAQVRACPCYRAGLRQQQDNRTTSSPTTSVSEGRKSAGTPVDEETLQAYLTQSAELNPMPWVVFDPSGADCELGVRVRNLIDGSYPCREGLCGQGTRAAFDAARFRTPAPR